MKKTAAKKPVAPKKTTQAKEKSWPNWTTRNSPTFSTYRPDRWGRLEPNSFDLVGAFDDTVYACATLISSKIAATPIRLFVKTDRGQEQPKCATRAINLKTFRRLKDKALTAIDIKEVATHPLLKLLGYNPYHNKIELLELTQLYMEITGNAFWLIIKDQLATPSELYLLPSQYVSLERDDNQKIIAYRFDNGSQTYIYKPEDIIHFKFPSLVDPYGLGMPPLRAAWDRVQISLKELGYLDATLSNNARPDALLTPTEPIAPNEAERLAKEYYQRFSNYGSGGILVADGPMDVKPLSFPPKDLAGLDIAQAIKTAVCNVFHVPISLLEEQESNYASATVAKENFATNCLAPRMERIIHKLNERLAPLFDERLFFENDNLVPLDRVYELDKITRLLASGVITREEAREMEGLEPQPWAEVPLLPSGMLPADMMTTEPGGPELALPAPEEDSKDALASSQQIMALQTALVGGQITREMAVANAVIVLGLSQQQAEALFPQVEQQPQKLPQEQPQEPGEQHQEQPQKAQKAESSCPLVDVPDYRQQENYDCGAAATHSVCAYFGVGPESQEDFIKLLGTNPQDGTKVVNIIALLEKLGIQVEAKEDMMLEGLKALTAQGSPVICPIQDYGTPEQEAKDQSGHYVVVMGVDEAYIYLQDPSAGRVKATYQEFLDNWHDKDAETKYYRFGVACSKQ